MKPWILAIVALAVGAVIGAGITWSEFAGATAIYPTEGRAPDLSRQLVSDVADDGRIPVAVIEGIAKREVGYFHEFGSMEMGTTGELTIIIRNAGTAPLTLEKGKFSCTCSVAQLENDGDEMEIPPGGAAPVLLKWTPKEMSDHFMTEGDLITNDPVNSNFHITIGGKVVPGLRAIPSDLVVEGISANEAHELGFAIYDFRGGPLSVKEHRLDKADTAANFEISYEPMSPEDLADEPGAKGGFQFTVAVKPGLPLGPINQKIHVTLDREASEEIVIPIRGRVVGDITFLGQGYDAAKGFVTLGSVSSQTGMSRTVHVMVKGPHRHEMDLTITRIRPEGVLEATLGEPRQINDGAVVMIPLEIRIPPGAPAGDHLGNQPGSMGLIELEASGPQPEKVLFYASFLVENP